MLGEWRDLILLALDPYVKKLQGHEPKGFYLDHALDPVKLDEVVTGLVKRKVLSFD
jgi:hypothetical protein